MTAVKRLARNTTGRDLIIGDIHGHFTKARAALDAVGFDPEKDRVISVGDLVDRGPESELCLDWLTNDWFHAVRGNHEQMAIQYVRDGEGVGLYAMNGGAWLIDKLPYQREEFLLALDQLPVAIELDTGVGIVGIVHAECPSDTWTRFTHRLEMGGGVADAAADAAMWSRNRIDHGDDSQVPDVRAVIVGHTPINFWTSLGNTIFIDTMGWKGKDFTILDAATLQPATPVKAAA